MPEENDGRTVRLFVVIQQVQRSQHLVHICCWFEWCPVVRNGLIAKGKNLDFVDGIKTTFG